MKRTYTVDGRAVQTESVTTADGVTHYRCTLSDGTFIGSAVKDPQYVTEWQWGCQYPTDERPRFGSYRTLRKVIHWLLWHHERSAA